MFRLIALLLAIFSALWTAVFLLVLDVLTDWREANIYVLWFLPVAGVGIAWMYQRFGEKAALGNAHIKQAFSIEGEKIDARMAPLVLLGTWLTHLFGGSAGREGTAVQMSAAFTGAIEQHFSLSGGQKRLLIRVAVAAGFAAVFGTPLAGFYFSLEYLKKESLGTFDHIMVLLCAALAHVTCILAGVVHTDYSFALYPLLSWKLLLVAVLMIILAVAIGRLYSYCFSFLSDGLRRLLPNVYLRIAFGGFVIAALVYLMDSTKFIGLGIPTIESAFTMYLPPYDFILKLLFTAFTLAAGFRGGDVTPLFFIGAVAGSALAGFTDLPAAPLAAIGFVTVFGTVYKTPLTTIVLFVELFLF